MGVSKKLRNKRKRNLIASLFGIAILTSMLAVIKVTGILMPTEDVEKLSMQKELKTEYQSSNDSIQDNIANSLSNVEKNEEEASITLTNNSGNENKPESDSMDMGK